MTASPRSDANAAPLRHLLDSGRLIVCVGPGGVGKTTTSAAVGLRAAMAGRKTIVMTIDPARRLANSLGLDDLTNDPQQIDLTEALKLTGNKDNGGELWAMMLDSEKTFNDLVDRLAPDKGALKRAKENNIFRLLSSALHGMQEYMALEKLHDLYTGGYFDLVILDTPPTKNALEFLETPGRASTFFDERIIKWFLPNRKSGLLGRVFNPGSIVLGLISKVLGESFVNDLVEFFDTFHYLQETLQQRGELIEFILRDPLTHFFIITSADPRRIKEAVYFHEKLGQLEQRADFFIINRVIPRFHPEDIAAIEDADLDTLLREADHGASAEHISGLRQRLETHYLQLAKLAIRDREAIASLATKVGQEALRLIPLLGEDVHNLTHLLKLSDFITPLEPDARVATAKG
ncbi:ArsA family ATPase [Bradymonadaceae bacterium TMQ3]|uniref:ArsA family ATPase n=1 Tax=Lujinxingia sediminis TaxID=2480984 RepID=A0ABY0CSP5_9DELT|nr:ArsA-related P-loop ATPase [Lujinxingia sediminis]RDV38893.1 ArsA family ATPase [Bradymonadaceae bacterium TMQ3]RVU44127.1 ArsA family ATPase [Lujinxingia sediminis]TXC76335.1 ArsA family ATPase [Bradymonadales bacterium TMQ1]